MNENEGGLYGKTGMKTPVAKGNCSGYICTSRCVSYEHFPRCMKCALVHEGSKIAT